MVALNSPRDILIQRQATDPLPAPSASGLTSAITQTAATPTGGGLAIDSGVSKGPSVTPPPLVSNTPTITITPTPSTTNTTTSTSSVPSAASGSTSPIPMSTVIGACVGAFIGAVALIILGLWFYKRYSRSLKKYSRTRSRFSLARSRNLTADQERSRSRQEPWNKLEDGDDKWEGMYQTKEVDNVAPMEKLTMFKKSPSVRTAYTHKSDEPEPFVQYHPSLPGELVSDKNSGMPVPRPFLGRADPNPTVTWDGDSIGNGSFLSLNSDRLLGGAMSPTLNKAIPTPAATSSYAHRWESAEIVHVENSQPADDGKNPFEHDSERRKNSGDNPFYKAQDPPYSRSRSNSAAQSPPKSNKGKERAISTISTDPFSDSLQIPQPFTATHTTQTSLSSVTSNDRAIQSLIAALDISEDEVQERLRAVSIQPSIISATSEYTSEYTAGEEDVTGSFPLPPSSVGDHSDRH